jgi:hypothetical protein
MGGVFSICRIEKMGLTTSQLEITVVGATYNRDFAINQDSITWSEGITSLYPPDFITLTTLSNVKIRARPIVRGVDITGAHITADDHKMLTPQSSRWSKFLNLFASQNHMRVLPIQKVEYIYLTRLCAHVTTGSPIYKVGKTKQYPDRKIDRFYSKEYHKGSEIIYLLHCTNSDELERTLLVEMEKHFKIACGKETFIGDLKDIQKVLFDVYLRHGAIRPI